MNATALSARSVGVAFLAGIIATLVPHQLVALAVGLPAYSMAATKPFGVPEFISLAFFGGLWAIVISLIVPRLPGMFNGWLGWVVLGAVLPTLVLWFVVAPLKGIPMNILLSPPLLLVVPILHAIWGGASWVLIRVADMVVPEAA